ncbi:hypothetical protein JOB18_009315 [Solea senegalensis]|uniref:Uncharacterized protein n=1 Tax=Solea senegalensis TaxID=28829 RepID=A0AAV6SR07_SOLSE|nr:hypothetical protein JOB18_009315 [Solea senegalensis]
MDGNKRNRGCESVEDKMSSKFIIRPQTPDDNRITAEKSHHVQSKALWDAAAHDKTG